MLVSFEGRDWFAKAMMSDSPTPDGWTHVEVIGGGPNLESALNGATAVMNLLARNRTAMVRVAPEADTSYDFEKKINIFKGYARFSFKTEGGEWLSAPVDSRLSFIGASHGRD